MSSHPSQKFRIKIPGIRKNPRELLLLVGDVVSMAVFFKKMHDKRESKTRRPATFLNLRCIYKSLVCCYLLATTCTVSIAHAKANTFYEAHLPRMTPTFRRTKTMLPASGQLSLFRTVIFFHTFARLAACIKADGEEKSESGLN